MKARILAVALVMVLMTGCSTSPPTPQSWGDDRVARELPAEFAAHLAAGERPEAERSAGVSRFVRLSSWVLN